jgi:hypothetical protein
MEESQWHIQNTSEKDSGYCQSLAGSKAKLVDEGHGENEDEHVLVNAIKPEIIPVNVVPVTQYARSSSVIDCEPEWHRINVGAMTQMYATPENAIQV